MERSVEQNHRCMVLKHQCVATVLVQMPAVSDAPCTAALVQRRLCPGLRCTLLPTPIRPLPTHTACALQIRLPRELLSKHHVNTRGLSAAPAGLDNVAFALGSIANTHLENARSLSLPRDAVAPLLPAVAAQRFLRQLERAAFDTFDPKLQRRDSTLPLALLWARVAGSL
eukprot:m.374698 g.374698  ORF g.374698 m.374698 type:complete len:170 (+) comp20908_c0_seq26:16-525(+)